MTSNREFQVLKAGYTLIRAENNSAYGLIIKEKSIAYPNKWKIKLAGFQSIEQLNQFLAELLKDPHYVDLYETLNSELPIENAEEQELPQVVEEKAVVA